ncbi:hypothetical protein [Streptomyces murinus]|uniref:hypothetical protein n=1 Tax=Streptomyces murinus TaxID=33900 RepID=UPI003F48A305
MSESSELVREGALRQASSSLDLGSVELLAGVVQEVLQQREGFLADAEPFDGDAVEGLQRTALVVPVPGGGLGFGDRAGVGQREHRGGGEGIDHQRLDVGSLDVAEQ